MIAELKEALVDKKSPFGVDLLLPKVGEGARATNVSSLLFNRKVDEKKIGVEKQTLKNEHKSRGAKSMNEASRWIKWGEILIPRQYDYTKGALGELIDIVIESGAKLFVSAVGVAPVWAIEKLHNAGVL